MADAVAVRGRQPVPARVLSGGYTTHSGDDATTWEAYGTYEYTVTLFDRGAAAPGG